MKIYLDKTMCKKAENNFCINLSRKHAIQETRNLVDSFGQAHVKVLRQGDVKINCVNNQNLYDSY